MDAAIFAQLDNWSANNVSYCRRTFISSWLAAAVSMMQASMDRAEEYMEQALSMPTSKNEAEYIRSDSEKISHIIHSIHSTPG